MNKPKLLDEFEKYVETVIVVLEDCVSIIDQWIEDLPQSARTGGRFVPRRTIDDLLLMLRSFYLLGDSFPEIQRFLIIHVPQYEGRVKKSYSDIKEKIQEIIGKCEQDPHPLNPPPNHLPNPAIPFYEMGELRHYIMEDLVKDLRYCVKEAKEKSETEQKKPDDLIDLYKAVGLYHRSRAQLKRDIEDGKIRDYRKIERGKHWISKREADNLYISK